METGAMQALYERLLPLFSKKQLMENVPMSRYTTLHLGGPAQLLCEPYFSILDLIKFIINIVITT